MFLGGRSCCICNTYNRKCILKGSLHTFRCVEKDVISEEPEFFQFECSGQCSHSLDRNHLVGAYLSAFGCFSPLI